MDDQHEAEFHRRMGQPQVSVVLPVWNGERYLQESVDSILAQDFRDFELIIVDDGSTDATGEIIGRYAGDPRVRVHRQENRGLVAALNVGLELSKADLIARLDADDIARSDRLSLQLAYLHENPDVMAVGSAIELMDAEGRGLGIRHYPVGKGMATRGLLDGCTLAHPAVMMRKAAVLKVGAYRECFRHAEDYDLWLRLMELGQVDNLPEALIRYRMHAQSITKRHSARQNFAAKAALLLYRRRLAGDRAGDRLGAKPITYHDLAGLNLSAAEQAGLALARLALLFADEASPAEVEATMEWTWGLRKHLRRGQYVRHGLMPGARFLFSAKQGRPFRWLARSFATEPFSACWMLLKLILGRSG
jgi:GT2 family glycosyltransferase